MKFEHLVKDLYPEKNEASEQIELLNHYGNQGWELVSVSGIFAYFKRPLRSKSKDEIMKHFDRQSLV